MNMHVHINIDPLHSIKLQFIYTIANFTKILSSIIKKHCLQGKGTNYHQMFK